MEVETTDKTQLLKVNNNFFSVKNQYFLENDNFIVFQSYETTMLIYNKDKKYISFNTNEYNYTTTSKYLKQVLDYIYYSTYSDNLKLLIDSKNRKKDILSCWKGVFHL